MLLPRNAATAAGVVLVAPYVREQERRGLPVLVLFVAVFVVVAVAVA
jgi:hypothetical protein